MKAISEYDPLVEHYLAASHAANTCRAYESDLRHLIAWGGTAPSCPEQIAKYLAQHAGLLKVSSLRRRLAAIAMCHRDLGEDDPTKAAIVRRVLRGIERRHAVRPQQVCAISLPQLAAMIGELSDDKAGLRDK